MDKISFSTAYNPAHTTVCFVPVSQVVYHPRRQNFGQRHALITPVLQVTGDSDRRLFDFLCRDFPAARVESSQGDVGPQVRLSSMELAAGGCVKTLNGCLTDRRC